MKTVEDAANKLQKHSKEEQRQMKEANFAFTEANKQSIEEREPLEIVCN